MILQATAYCGMPAGIEGFRVASQAIKSYKAEQEAKGHNVEAHSDVGVEHRMKTDDV